MIDGIYRIVGEISTNHRRISQGDEIYLKEDEYGNIRGPAVDWEGRETGIGYILCPDTLEKIPGKTDHEAYRIWIDTVLEKVE
ncbi:hypothetical protein Aes012_092 [Aeromonas phage Aes012]|uniref:Uncharacterized protein n=1 Tax=Aeromonas phage Aes012 TaxID=1198014 RepID=I6ZRC6_9CAUD|nr:hypothetical protein Aes012_092 [Aeromonas phage Aes012]AFN69722.1 hypothetical protein Aes012_092 [Aeromonas phage Aes012]